jgi:hypothetical protein
MFAAARHPEPHRPSAAGADRAGVEAADHWAGDDEAAARVDSPAAIRAALLPEQTAEFDAAYDAALTAARKTLRLDDLHRVLSTWRRMALLTDQDPDRQRKMLAAETEIRKTGQSRPGSVSWDDLSKELGL